MTVDHQTPYHDVFFAHQPVFDVKQRVWCYELYFRDSVNAGAALFSDGDELQASMEVLANIALCPDKRLQSTKVIINYPVQAIVEKVPYSLHPDTTIIQIADVPQFPPALIEEVKQLKVSGYMFSIDDYKAYPDNLEIYRLADIITLSVIDHDEDETRRLLRAFPDLQTAYLAKKIETQEQFLQAEDQGFDLFQGYFFKLPKTETVRKISSNEMLRFEILEQLCAPELDFDSLTAIIARDASLSMRLINLLNSPVYGLVTRISSLKQALVYVGLDQLKQWLRVILLTDMEQPHTTKELMRTSLQRAKFLEIISSRSGRQQEDNRLFLVGLFSLLDAILLVPMERIVCCLSALEEEIRKTLQGDEAEFTAWLRLADSLENSDWDRVGALSAILHLDSFEIMESYTAALEWANKALAGSSR